MIQHCKKSICCCSFALEFSTVLCLPWWLHKTWIVFFLRHWLNFKCVEGLRKLFWVFSYLPFYPSFSLFFFICRHQKQSDARADVHHDRFLLYPSSVWQMGLWKVDFYKLLLWNARIIHYILSRKFLSISKASVFISSWFKWSFIVIWWILLLSIDFKNAKSSLAKNVIRGAKIPLNTDY